MNRSRGLRPLTMGGRFAAALLSGVAATAGCSRPGPRPIALGAESCAHCHMTIADPRFTAEFVTRTGRVFVFDDIGCLSAWLADTAEPAAQAGAPWVADITTPDRWLPAATAHFLQRADLSTPMESGLVAFPTRAQADSARAVTGGQVLSWSQVLAAGRNPARPPG